MDFIIQPIETKRLLLRPLELNDAEDMFEYASKPENIGYVGFKPHESLDETKATITNQFLSKPEKRMPETWAIVLKENQKMIGTIDFHTLNKRNFEGEVGYILNMDYWNQGLTSEALKAVLDFGFKTFQLNSITAKCHPLNYASSKVMIKAGMDFLDCENDEHDQLKYLVYEKVNTKGMKHHESKNTREKVQSSRSRRK
jgi:[ribosomal protein S5]-alanine N-acetyltransferase